VPFAAIVESQSRLDGGVTLTGISSELLAHERALAAMVERAYGLTPEEIALMWRTAPPRMPLPSPAE
jgi:hypothetical protein